MTIALPFNYNPDSVDVKTNTTNEAIAADTYAYIYAEVEYGGQFYINDELALDSEDPVVSSADDAGGSSYTLIYTAPTDRTVVFDIYAGNVSGSGTIRVKPGGLTSTYDLFTYNNSLDSALKVYLSDGDLIEFSSGSANNQYLLTGEIVNAVTHRSGHFWVKTGTDLRISGSGRYTIMNYTLA